MARHAQRHEPGVRRPIHRTLAFSMVTARPAEITRDSRSAASAGRCGCACEHASCIFLRACPATRAAMLHRLDHVPFRMRSIPTGVSHLSRADPSPSHRAHLLLRDAGGCDDGSATRCTCSHGLTGRLRSEGKKCPTHPKRGQVDRAHQACPNQRHCAVRASDISNCRYQHPPAPLQTSSRKKRTPLVL